MNTKDILKILIKDKKIIILVVSICTIISIIYSFFIATPKYTSETNFYVKQPSNSFSDINSPFGNILEKQMGLGSNDKTFNISIPDLIYRSDIILDYLIEGKFKSISKDAIALSYFWEFDGIKDNNERIFLLKKRLRNSIDINIMSILEQTI